MIILALDTALETCSAALLDGERVLAARSEAMARGHQERLAPLVAELMVEAGIGFDRLDRIGVTVGPGSFTGLRVGLAFAKGLGVALGIRVVGVGTLDAFAMSGSGLVGAVIDARRDQFYVQAFRTNSPNILPDEVMQPIALAFEDAVAALIHADIDCEGPDVLVGAAAGRFAERFPAAKVLTRTAPDPVHVAMAAAAAPDWYGPPRPIYLRAPDAKLPASALSA